MLGVLRDVADGLRMWGCVLALEGRFEFVFHKYQMVHKN